MARYAKHGKSVPIGAVLIGALFIFIVVVLMMIPYIPFQVTQNEQIIIYLVAFLSMGGMLVMLMRYSL